MPSPRNSLWLPITLLFVGAGLGLGGGIWWRSDGVQPNANAESAETLTGAWWEGERWLSAEQIESAVSGMSAKELQEFFAGDGKWYRRPNGPRVFRAMMRRLVSLEDPVKVATVVLAWLRREELTVATRANLLREVAEILAAKEGFDGGVLASLVRGYSREDLAAMMEGWLTVRPTESPEAAVAYARRWLIAAGLTDDKELEVLAQSIALLVWMKRDRELTIRLAAKSDRMAVRAVLIPELRRLLAIDPPAAIRLLKTAIEAGVYPEACGESAFQAGITAAQFRAALEGLPVEKFGRYVELYAARMHHATPDELAELTKAFSAREVFAMWNTGDKVLPHGSFAIVSGLAQMDPNATREWLATLSPEHRLRVLQGIWTFPGLSNARIAQLCVEEPKFFEKFNEPTSRIFEALADGDLGNAMRALELIPSEQRHAAEVNFRQSKIVNDHRGDLASALSAADAAPEKLRAEIRDALIRSFVSDDPQLLHEWIRSHPNDRDEMEIRLLDSVSLGKDRGSAELIARRLKENPSDAKALELANEFARRFVFEDPIAGLDWLSKLPARPEMNAQVRNMAERSFSSNREAAAAWVKNLPPGDWRDEASAGIAGVARFEPEEALRWASSIENEEKRLEVIGNLVDSWVKADPTKAMSIVGEAALNDAQREELRLRVQSRSAFRKGVR